MIVSQIVPAPLVDLRREMIEQQVDKPADVNERRAQIVRDRVSEISPSPIWAARSSAVRSSIRRVELRVQSARLSWVPSFR